MKSQGEKGFCTLFFFFISFVFASCDDQMEDGLHFSDEFSKVSTLAGSESPGLVDGIGTLAKFNFPCGMVLDRAGNLYVSDHSNHCIRKIAPGGVVSTYAGTGMPGEDNGYRLNATFNHPYGLAVDGDGNLYVGDQFNHRIRKIN